MKKRRRNPKYKEGDWFSVPLEEGGGYATGLIARGKNHVLFGYFFGPKLKNLPTIENVRVLTARDAIFFGRFSDRGLFFDEWKNIGHLDLWDRGQWPMPLFVRKSVLSGKITRVKYLDEDPLYDIENSPGVEEDLSLYPQDCISGSGSIEIKLTRLLA